MIFEFDLKKTGRITASLPVDNTIQVYECQPSICMNPFCDCNEVFLQLNYLDKTHKLGIDIAEKQLINREDAVIDDFSKQLFSLLDESDFIVLNEVYYVFKQVASEQCDFSKLKVSFSENDIERQGVMIGYNEIFTYGFAFTITIKGTNYAVLDDYCIKSQCTCTKTIFSFYAIPNENIDDRITIGGKKSDFAIHINYLSKTWEFETNPQAEQIEIAQVRSALEDKYEDFYQRLQQRQQRLKLLYKNYLASVQPIKSQKIGRNEPCPCGSGKKYKKCCGVA